jgi:hypothetical protein
MPASFQSISDLLFTHRPTVGPTELAKLTVMLNKPQKGDLPWWCRSVTMSLLTVGISGDETEKLAISRQICMHHHSTTATFTGLFLQYKVHEDREESNPHTGPSFAHRSLSGTRWRKAVPAFSSCIEVSRKKQVNFAEILYRSHPKYSYIQNCTQHSTLVFNSVRIQKQ